jgi:hypothetical protein
MITNYNRERLRALNKPALAADVAPTEDDSIDFVYKTELRFGFEYCNFVLDRL